MRPRTENLRWGGLVADFPEGPHHDARHGRERVARVVACHELYGMPVLPHPSGRRRRLFLALARVGGTWAVAGVYKSLRTAKRMAEAAYFRKPPGLAAEPPMPQLTAQRDPGAALHPRVAQGATSQAWGLAAGLW
jgi:hypothetical protein